LIGTQLDVSVTDLNGRGPMQLKNLIHVRDIEYFEGPLLSEYKDENGNSYIKKWCSWNDVSETWLLVLTTKNNINAYLSKNISLLKLIENGKQFIIETRNINGSSSSHNVMFEDIDVDYLPKNDAFYDESLAPRLTKK
jgi:hypothetical protein